LLYRSQAALLALVIKVSHAGIEGELSMNVRFTLIRPSLEVSMPETLLIVPW